MMSVNNCPVAVLQTPKAGEQWIRIRSFINEIPVYQPLIAKRPIYGSQGAGFSSRTTHYMLWSIMTILLQFCWDLFFEFVYFSKKSVYKKLNPVI